jgi:hypothetical protein
MLAVFVQHVMFRLVNKGDKTIERNHEQNKNKK